MLIHRFLPQIGGISHPDLGARSRRRAPADSNRRFFGSSLPFGVSGGKTFACERSPVIGKPVANRPSHFEAPNSQNAAKCRKSRVLSFPAAGLMEGPSKPPHLTWPAEAEFANFYSEANWDPRKSTIWRGSCSATKRAAFQVSRGNGVSAANGKG